jgi:hypothetical protein
MVVVLSAKGADSVMLSAMGVDGVVGAAKVR